jgi:lysophospholipase L1-like esterase
MPIDPFQIKGPLRYPIILWVLTVDRLQNWFWYLVSRLTGHTLYHVIGDSHTRPFRGNKWCYIHHLGAATAYNLQNPKSSTGAHQKLWKIVNSMDKNRDKVIMVFGEIDCRIHIYNQFKKKNEEIGISQLITNTIETYGKTLVELRDSGVNVLVFGIPPASHQENTYNYTYYAPPDYRVTINKDFNEGLQKFCEKNDLSYYNIYEKTVDSEGFMAEEFAYDQIHLDNKVMAYVNVWLEELEKGNNK